MELKMNLRQTISLSPQMVQSMEILQMGAQELEEYVERQLLENPALEREEHSAGEELRELRQKLEWLEAGDRQNHWYHRQDREAEWEPQIAGAPEGEELYFHLISQLSELDQPRDRLRLVVGLCQCLDGRGFLDESLESLAADLGAELPELEAALEVLQSLEPAGVGARDLAECLCLQLKRRGGSDLALRMVAEHLEALGKNRLGSIARKLKVTQAAVEQAAEEIRALDPRPCGAYGGAEESAHYLKPDLMLRFVDGEPDLIPGEGEAPVLRISAEYSRLYRESEDRELKDYLNEKLRQAKGLVAGVAQRQKTLELCGLCIADWQRDFFLGLQEHPRPMGLRQVAEMAQVHESTVSRAIRDKYIQCDRGLYPLQFFFSRDLSGGEEGENRSPQAAKSRIRALIEAETPGQPLSDRQIAETLEREGWTLSRRTVAKYREELGIPGTAGRR